MTGTEDNRQPLYLTIEDDVEGFGLRLTVSERRDPQTKLFDTHTSPFEDYDKERKRVLRDPRSLSYVLSEIKIQHPEHRIVPEINMRDRDQFFVAYRTETGRDLQDFLQA